MGRNSDWSVVGMTSDPTPGDPERVRQLADRLQEFADDAEEALSKTKALLEEETLATFVGLRAEAFRDRFEKVPPNLTKLHTSYDLAAAALSRYWPLLEDAQSDADTALANADGAKAELDTARSTLAAALASLEDAEEAADPDADEVSAEVRRALLAAETAAGEARTAVESAQSRLDAAIGLAQQAKEAREEAAQHCTADLEEASDAGMQNKKWWQKAVSWVVDNWDTIVAIAKIVVAVLGVVVMIIGGPLAWIVLAAALIVLADTLIKYANGVASLWDVAFAALDCIPGFKGLTTAAGFARGLRSGFSAAPGGLSDIGGAMRRRAHRFKKQPAAIHADAMNPADAQRFVDKHYPWLNDVNNTGARNYTDNCSNCVVTVDRRLDGVDVGAAPLPSPQWPNKKALGAENVNYQQVNSYDDITQSLVSRGEGSRSIVYIGRPDGSAHVFNAVNSPHGVVYLDGQTGQLAQLEQGVSQISHLPYR
jgi:hypothetical protein